MAQEPEAKSTGAFALNDAFDLPDPGPQTAVRTFHAAGRDWTITIRADGKTRAQEYYKLTALCQRAVMECGDAPGFPRTEEGPPLSVSLPPMGLETIEVTDSGYLSRLYVLAAVAEDPKGTPEEWAIFGHKLGDPVVFDQILEWASAENGIGMWLMAQIEALKNALGSSEQPTTGSGGPASPKRTKPRRSR